MYPIYVCYPKSMTKIPVPQELRGEFEGLQASGAEA